MEGHLSTTSGWNTHVRNYLPCHQLVAVLGVTHMFGRYSTLTRKPSRTIDPRKSGSTEHFQATRLGISWDCSPSLKASAILVKICQPICQVGWTSCRIHHGNQPWLAVVRWLKQPARRMIKLHHLHYFSVFEITSYSWSNYINQPLWDNKLTTKCSVFVDRDNGFDPLDIIKLDHHLMLKLQTQQSDPLSSDIEVRTHDIPVMHCASPVLPLLLVIYPAYFTNIIHSPYWSGHGIINQLQSAWNQV